MSGMAISLPERKRVVITVLMRSIARVCSAKKAAGRYTELNPRRFVFTRGSKPKKAQSPSFRVNNFR